MIRILSMRAALWLLIPLAATALGCGTENEDHFEGTGEFSLTIPDADGKRSLQRIATLPKLGFRHGKRGGTDLVLDRSCALRSLGGSVTGTYSCQVASTLGAVALELQSGTWKITEQPSAYSADGCQLHRHDVVVDSSGIIRGRSDTAVTLHFEGRRELQVCPQHGGEGSGGSLWAWTEEPYTSDSGWEDGYDWDNDGVVDDSGGAGGDWNGADNGGGDGDDGGGDGDDGDGDGDDGGGDDGDWAADRASKSKPLRASHRHCRAARASGGRICFSLREKQSRPVHQGGLLGGLLSP